MNAQLETSAATNSIPISVGSEQRDYTVRREGAIWHHLGCQILVQKTTPLMVPIGTLWGCRVAPSQEGATMAPLLRGCHQKVPSWHPRKKVPHGTLRLGTSYSRCQKAPFSVWYLATFTCAIIINKEPTEAVDGGGGVTYLWSCFSLGIVCMGVCLCALGIFSDTYHCKQQTQLWIMTA